MKTIGMIGGTTWVSTVEYYSLINRITNERFGGINSAKIILYSVNLEEFSPISVPGGWGSIAKGYSEIARKLETGGADCILICANTFHIIADDIQKNIKIPIIHIAEETAKEIAKQKLSKVGLLGTKITMESHFFSDKLAKAGIASITPEESDRDFIHLSIFKELGKELFKPETKKKYLQIIGELKNKGAEGIILGCTEIPLLIKQSDSNLPLFDTTLIHSKAAVDFALG